VADGLSPPVFGPDGTVYLRTGEDGDQQQLVALDAAGHVKSGWPINAAAGSSFGPPVARSGGPVYVEECGGQRVGCVVHRFEIDGIETPRWPFDVPAAASCPVADTCASYLLLAPGDTVYRASWRRPTGQARLIAIDASGRMKPGWPVSLDDADDSPSEMQVAPDGSVFIVTSPNGSDNAGRLWALAPDGSIRAGWPVSVDARTSFQLGPHGTVVAMSHEPLLDPSQGGLCEDANRTVFTVLGPDGRTQPGWPRGSKGFAAGPVVDDDGSVSYLSARGNVYAHGATGEIKSGWPVAVPRAFPGCRSYGPYLGHDGTVYVLGDEVVAIFADGTGWRYRPAGELWWPCPESRSTPGVTLDTDCPGVSVAPGLASADVVYVAVHHGDSGEVVALDHNGHVKPGWPYQLPTDPTNSQVQSLTVSQDGRLYVVLGSSLILALDEDARISN
jgi:outer membrane protein assembly factor BamB